MQNYNYKILSLDGGGIRCALQGYALSKLPPVEYDLIAGTSGGAINAGLLAIGYTSKDIINFYTGECGKKIFKPYLLPFSLNPLGKFLHSSKYDSNNLYNVLKEKIGNIKLKDIKQNILVTAYDLKTRETCLFTNLNTSHLDFKLTDIIMASAAAPYYFTPYKFDNYICIDGGISANNPSLCAYSYIKSKYNIDSLVVSIGAGSFESSIDYEKMILNSPISFITNLIDCFMDGNADTIELNSEGALEDNYIRFQVRINKENNDLDNISYKNLQSLKNLTLSAVENEWKDNILKLNDKLK